MWRPIILVATLAFASACVNVVSIDADDRTRFAHLELSAPLGDDEQWRVQLRASSSDGEFDQSLDSGDRIEIGDNSIGGPATVAGKLDLVYYSIAIGTSTPGWELRADDSRFVYYLGIAMTEFDLEMSDGTARFGERDGTTELFGRWAIDIAANDVANFGFSWAASFGPDLSGINEVDLKFAYELASPLRVAGGYRWLEYNYAEKDDESHIEVDFHGPYFALELALD